MTTILTKQDCERVIEYFVDHYAVIGHPTLKCHVEQKISDLLDTKANGEFECLEKLTKLWQPLGFTTSLQDIVAGIKWRSEVISCPDGNRKCLTLHTVQVAEPSPNTDLLLFLKQLI